MLIFFSEICIHTLSNYFFMKTFLTKKKRIKKKACVTKVFIREDLNLENEILKVPNYERLGMETSNPS